MIEDRDDTLEAGPYRSTVVPSLSLGSWWQRVVCWLGFQHGDPMLIDDLVNVQVRKSRSHVILDITEAMDFCERFGLNAESGALFCKYCGSVQKWYWH